MSDEKHSKRNKYLYITLPILFLLLISGFAYVVIESLNNKFASLSAKQDEHCMRISAVTGENKKVFSELKKLESDNSVMQEKLEQLQLKLSSLTTDRSSAWVLLEARYLINTASLRLKTSNDFSSVEWELKEALKIIQSLTDNQYHDLEKELQKSISEVSLVKTVDTNNILAKLDSAILISKKYSQSIVNLLERAPVKSTVETVNKEDDSYKNFFYKSWEEVKELVKIRSYSKEDFPVSLSLDEKIDSFSSVYFYLSEARWGLSRLDASLYQSSLAKAKTKLNTFKVLDKDKVTALMSIVDELLLVDITPNKPDLENLQLTINEAVKQL